MFGAELPYEEWWKESLTAGRSPVITRLKIRVLGGACSSIAAFEVGDSDDRVSLCHHSVSAACPSARVS